MLRQNSVFRSFSGPLSVRFASQQSKATPSENPPSKSHYEVLGIMPDATHTEVREAFFRKAKELHPDVNPAEDARERFEEVQNAFQALKNKKSRKVYDSKHDFTADIQKKVISELITWISFNDCFLIYRLRCMKNFGWRRKRPTRGRNCFRTNCIGIY